MKLSDERLEHLIRQCGGDRALAGQEGYIAGGPSSKELVLSLRELRDYRKAVREYLDAIDSIRAFPADIDDDEAFDLLIESRFAAEATLRALQERT